MLNHRVRLVDSFEQLLTTPFSGNVNALCWRRDLAGNFQEIIARLSAEAAVTSIDEDELRALKLTSDGVTARDTLLADQAALRRHGLAPSLELVHAYQQDDTDSAISTDVYSFHVDSATVPADTFLCTYAGSATEGLPNESAMRRVDVPETRARLLKDFGGADDARFAGYLGENCYDLHYAALPGAEPYSFGVGHVWRIAIDCPGRVVLPCIHRAPATFPGSPPRLLLIS